MWSDSQIVLYWINSSKKLPQFVSNRVAEIQQSTSMTSWKYCPSGDNPADLLTRGLTADQFNDTLDLWMHGPTWLHVQSQWPTWQQSDVSHLHAIAAVSDIFQPETQTPFTTGLRYVFNISNYSRLNRLLVVTAHVFRFIYNLRHPRQQCTGPISVTELDRARKSWIGDCQKEVYWREITNLVSTSPSKNRLTLVRQLQLLLDNEGIVRCGGRIHNAPVSELTKFPYLLSPTHPFTALVVYSIHIKFYHTGIIGTLTAIRQSYWIPRGRQ